MVNKTLYNVAEINFNLNIVTFSSIPCKEDREASRLGYLYAIISSASHEGASDDISYYTRHISKAISFESSTVTQRDVIAPTPYAFIPAAILERLGRPKKVYVQFVVSDDSRKVADLFDGTLVEFLKSNRLNALSAMGISNILTSIPIDTTMPILTTTPIDTTTPIVTATPRVQGATDDDVGVSVTGTDEGEGDKVSLATFEREKFTELVGGMDDVLEEVYTRAILSRTLDADLVDEFGLDHVRGLILYGPPGTGKTHFAKNLAFKALGLPESRVRVVNASELNDKFIGETERKTRELVAPARARPDLLHVVIFDEIDAIGVKRDSRDEKCDLQGKFLASLLALVDGMDSVSNVLFIGTTNRLHALDPALTRPGRFEVCVEIGQPCAASRASILCVVARSLLRSNRVDEDDLTRFSEECDGATAAALASTVRQAVLSRIRRAVGSASEDVRSVRVSLEDLRAAWRVVQHGREIV